MTAQPMMLDVDTGIDDAAAIAFAVGAGVDIVGITTVAGNCPIDLSTDNTLRVLTHLDAEAVPVFRGASRPLVASLHHAPYMHGDDGLGGANLPAAQVDEQELTAPEAIVAMAEEFAGELVFISVGPLTNLAIAMSLRPQIVDQIARVVIMGGAYFTPGNRTPYAEFNAYIDADALHQVFQGSWNEIYAIGLDVTHQVQISPSVWHGIPEDAEGTAGLVRAVSKRAIEGKTKDPFYLHDPLAVGVALDPSLVTTEQSSVRVETVGERRGQTVVEEGGNVRVARGVDGPAFMQVFCDAVGIRCGDNA